MPINPTPTPGQRTWKINITGPDNVEFTIEAYTVMSTEAQADAATQSLINHLAAWPGLVSLGYAQKQTLETYTITPDGESGGTGGTGGRPIDSPGSDRPVPPGRA